MVDFSRFDDCILQEILSRLPAKSLAQLKSINKQWHNLISSPLFVSLQATRSLDNALGILSVTAHPSGGRLLYTPLDDSSPSDHPDTTLRGHVYRISIRAASNGLLFCRLNDRGHEYILGNPTTKSFLRIPIPPKDNPYGPMDGMSSDVLYGLAFDPSVLQPGAKLVACTRIGRCLTFDVYSSRTNEWTASGAIGSCKKRNNRLFDTASSVYVGGALHWLVERQDIIAFDVEAERVYTVRLPVGVEATAVARGYPDVWLGIVKGRMSIVKIDKGIKVWEMEEYESRVWESKKCVEMPEEEHGVGDGRRYYRINVPLFYDGDKCVMLTWTAEERWRKYGLAVYRFGLGRWDRIRKLQGWVDGLSHFCPFISHLVGLN